MPSQETATGHATDHREHLENRPSLVGVSVRGDDIEPVKGIRAIALLFRGMATLLLILMVMKVFFGVTSTVPVSPGVLFAEAVRLVIFAGLLWGAGDLGVLWVKSHYDIRATRILTARIDHTLREIADAMPAQPASGPSSPSGRAT